MLFFLKNQPTKHFTMKNAISNGFSIDFLEFRLIDKKSVSEKKDYNASFVK